MEVILLVAAVVFFLVGCLWITSATMVRRSLAIRLICLYTCWAFAAGSGTATIV